MTTTIELNADLSVDLTYGTPEDGLVFDQHLGPELAMHCHGQLLYLAEHPDFDGDAAYQLISAEVADPRSAVCREPLSTEDAHAFYIRLTGLLPEAASDRDPAHLRHERQTVAAADECRLDGG